MTKAGPARQRQPLRRREQAEEERVLTGLIVVGVVMPFGDSGWRLTNTALFAIVLAETVRYALIVAGYRRMPCLAH
jgi:hypothetical protein